MLPVRVYVGMWRGFKKQFSAFRESRPGSRFKDYYRSRRASGEKSAVIWRVVHVVGAVIAIALGVFLSLVPGVPGFVFVLLGGALLAAQSLRIADLLDSGEVKIRALVGRWRRRRKVQRAPGR